MRTYSVRIWFVYVRIVRIRTYFHYQNPLGGHIRTYEHIRTYTNNIRTIYVRYTYVYVRSTYVYWSGLLTGFGNGDNRIHLYTFVYDSYISWIYAQLKHFQYAVHTCYTYNTSVYIHIQVIQIIRIIQTIHTNTYNTDIYRHIRILMYTYIYIPIQDIRMYTYIRLYTYVYVIYWVYELGIAYTYGKYTYVYVRIQAIRSIRLYVHIHMYT